MIDTKDKKDEMKQKSADASEEIKKVADTTKDVSYKPVNKDIK